MLNLWSDWNHSLFIYKKKKHASTILGQLVSYNIHLNNIVKFDNFSLFYYFLASALTGQKKNLKGTNISIFDCGECSTTHTSIKDLVKHAMDTHGE